ncbi:MAG: response regulator [Legionella sp.]|nr:response regulator [Legionella sp.]
MKHNNYWEGHEFIEELVNQLPAAIFWKDKNSVFLGCNQYFANLAGLSSPQEIIGKTDNDLPWGKYEADLYKKIDQEVMQNKKPILDIEETQTLADGRVLILLTNKIPLFYKKSNEIVGVLGIYHDITSRKQLERSLEVAKNQAVAANQAKTEFLENMRHDIRTPLTGIVGFADLLKMVSDNPIVKDYSENLVASSHALLDLLDEVLETIKVSTGEIPKLKKKFSLEQTLNSVIQLNRARAAQKNLILSLDIDPAIPKYVVGDKIRLHRVVLELIANALNFTDTGFVKLSAFLAREEDGKIILKLVVQDSGIGIPKDKQQEIYVRFKRLTPSYQGIYKGAGLGLSVVKQFIDELGGEIYIESKMNTGTSFICFIPLQVSLMDDASGVDEESETVIIDIPLEPPYVQQIKPCLKNAGGPFQVLVVEDNLIAQSAAKSLLTTLHCTVDLVDTGKKAMKLWENSHYDLIFMDIGLPDLDGYEVTQRIRLQELAKKTHSPIIALTAHVSEENKQRCIDAGMDAVFIKPLTTKSCADILNSFIPGYQQQLAMSVHADSSKSPTADELLFNLSEFPILDTEKGINIVGTEEILANMLKFMIHESLPADLKLMKNAHEALNLEEVQQCAHKIKGGAVYVGTTRIEMACQYLEAYWKSGRHDLFESLYNQAVRAIEETITNIEVWLRNKEYVCI